jgi:pimeloyl-ACP methyl ester carboxylesterase
MIRPPLRMLLLAAVLAIAPAGAGAAASAPTAQAAELATFLPDTAAIEADDHLAWRISFTVHNNYPVGVYLDSLFCEVQDLDPGETHGERTQNLDVSHIVAGNSISAGDLLPISYVMPATAEHAHLGFRLVLHRADKTTSTLHTEVEAMPGPISRDHPSKFLNVHGKRVEYVLFSAGRDSAPGLLFVHGRGANARTMLRNAMRIAPLGYTVMLVSMPGYGQSEGPADVAGPLTIAALGAALDQLKATPGVNPKRVAVWGVALGGAGVTLLSQSRSDIKATVSQSGFYDLWAVYRAQTEVSLREAIVRGAGSDSSAWRQRSAAFSKGKPAAILILHGAKDAYVPPQQAQGFADALKAQGVDVETRFFPNSGHELPIGDVMRTAIEFLDHRLEK